MPRLFLAIALFLLGSFGGAWVSVHQRSVDFSEAIDRRLSQATDTVLVPGAQATSATLADDAVIARVMSALAQSDLLSQSHGLREALAGLDSEQLSLVFERAVQLNDREKRDTLLMPLLRRWAAVNPADADRAIAPFLSRLRQTPMPRLGPDLSVGTAWARAFPEIALAEALANPGGMWARNSAHYATWELSADPLKVLDVLRDSPTGSLSEQLFRSALRTLAEKDPSLAETKLELIAEPRVRARIRAEILTTMAQRDPKAALDRVLKLAPEQGFGPASLNLVSRVLRTAAETDAATALRTVDLLPAEMRKHAVEAALVGWASKEPVTALQWAQENGVDAADAKAYVNINDFGGAGWEPLVGEALGADRERTLAWIREQPDAALRDSFFTQALGSGSYEQRSELFDQLTPEARVKGAAQMVDGLTRLNGSSAEQWVRAQAIESVRLPAIRHLAVLHTLTAETNSDSFADGWPAGPERDAALAGMSSSLVNIEPSRAVAVAGQIGTPDRKFAALVDVADHWLHRDEPAARQWVGGSPDFTEDQKRVILRTFDER